MTSTKQQSRNRRKIRVKGKLDAVAGDRPRLIVYRSLNNNYAQLIDSKTGKTIVNASDLTLKKSGTKIEMAKQVGIEIAKKALEKKIDTCVFDRNGYIYHGRIKSIADGAREGGLKF